MDTAASTARRATSRIPARISTGPRHKVGRDRSTPSLERAYHLRRHGLAHLEWMIRGIGSAAFLDGALSTGSPRSIDHISCTSTYSPGVLTALARGGKIKWNSSAVTANHEKSAITNDHHHQCDEGWIVFILSSMKEAISTSPVGMKGESFVIGVMKPFLLSCPIYLFSPALPGQPPTNRYSAHPFWISTSVPLYGRQVLPAQPPHRNVYQKLILTIPSMLLSSTGIRCILRFIIIHVIFNRIVSFYTVYRSLGQYPSFVTLPDLLKPIRLDIFDIISPRWQQSHNTLERTPSL